MTLAPRAIAEIASYHAHVYYDPLQSRAAAEAVRAGIDARFRVRLGRWHDVLVGPHSQAMYQVAFETALFPTLLPWLMINHHGLSILIHPNTHNPRRDHLEDGLWLGARLPILRERLPEWQEVADEAGAPNSAPHLPA